jgi:hypothetical protein
LKPAFSYATILPINSEVAMKMALLSDELLVEAYETALRAGLDLSFIFILRTEIDRRGLSTAFA